MEKREEYEANEKPQEELENRDLEEEITDQNTSEPFLNRTDFYVPWLPVKIKPYQKKAINIQEEEEEEEDIRPNLNLLDDSIDYSISNYESKKNTKNTQKEKETPKETLKSSSEKKRKIDSIETDEYGRKRFVFQKPNFSEENQFSTLKTIQKKLIYKKKDEEKNVPIFQSSRASRDLTPQQIRKSQQEHQRKLKRWEKFN